MRQLSCHLALWADCDAAFAEGCFRQLEGFGSYGFPESHAASFALLVHVSCWLKAHYPDTFAYALAPLEPDFRRRIVVHEAGHVVAAWAMCSTKPEAVFITASGGVTIFAQEPPRALTVPVLAARMGMLLAGRVAEEIGFGEPSTGAGMGQGCDLDQATRIAVEIETQCGLGETGLVYYPPGPIDLMRNPVLFSAIRARLAEVEADVADLLGKYSKELTALAELLDKRGHLSGREALDFLDGLTLRRVS